MNIRDIFRLKQKGLSNRKIASMLGISRNTVNHYLSNLADRDLALVEVLNYTDAVLWELFPVESETEDERFRTLSAYLPGFVRELKKVGCTRQTLWEDYLQKHPGGYLRSQFNYYLRQYLGKVTGSMKLTHKVGEKLYIDFTGKKLCYRDKETGKDVLTEVFVAILPASQYTFVCATPSQKKADVVKALNDCLCFLGGVPLAIVPDNLKTIVTKSHRHQPTINATFRDFAQHYGCVIDPTRAYSPQDKALVENAVRLVYQRIFYPLSKHTHLSLGSLNEHIATLLVDYNKKCFSQQDATREQEFLAIEKSFLQELPADVYQMRDFKKLKVQKMGHVYLSDDKHYYSVPYRFIGKTITLGYSDSCIEIFHKRVRIAIHKRDTRKGKYTTKEEHLSSQHKAYSQWSLDYFQKRASKIGVHTFDYITDLILAREYPEKAYKQAQGIIMLQKQYAAERIEQACLRAQGQGKHGYHIIANILKNGLDQVQVDDEPEIEIPTHGNIRAVYH